LDDAFAPYIFAALKAKHYYKVDKDYVVKDEQVRKTNPPGVNNKHCAVFYLDRARSFAGGNCR
jgi:hypothetical protein